MLYSSTVTGTELITSVKAELPIVPLPPDAAFVRWLSSFEQLVWSEVIRQERRAETKVANGIIALDGIPVPEDEDGVQASDVCAVYLDGVQAQPGNAEQGYLFSPECAVYREDGARQLAVDGTENGISATLIYTVRPMRRAGTVADQTAVIALPEEYIELAASRLRGEAYRAANEDELAAKWLADYNARLEAFTAWCDRRRAGGVR